MVLAAGFGKRMRPMTLTKPKPLQIIGGKTMLDRTLDKLIEAGIERAVVNVHWLGDQIEESLKARRDIEIVISREEELLDTGGGIAKALPYFERLPFFAVNADLPWFDEGEPSLLRMQKVWNPEIMDVLLLVAQTSKARGFSGTGDFAKDAGGRLRRKNLAPPRPYVMLAAQIVKPELFENPPSPVFSNNAIWTEAEARQRLFGVEHAGTCYHVGTPEDLKTANDLLETGKGWRV